MGMLKEKPRKVVRGAKTIFFLLTMSFSLLLFSLPILLLFADAVLPSALLLSTTATLADQFRSYDFRSSLVDIPITSLARSLVILFVYYLCDGPGLSRAPYMAVTTVCSLMSAGAVGMKVWVFRPREGWAVEWLFVSSVVLAVAHVVAAYRTSCRERRKLLVYKIDIEAVLACRKGIPSSYKFTQAKITL